MYIHRQLESELDKWYQEPYFKPLLLRGARQVGKSRLIREWGSKQFGTENFLEINLEEQGNLKTLFDTNLDINQIISELEFISGKNLKLRPFLLFIDEIQVCPQALVALRYFHERKPDLHVVAAGSLIDFVLEKISYPVGRIDTLELLPLSFFEFLKASEAAHLAESLLLHNITEPIPLAAHKTLLLELKKYYRIGGMPEAVTTYMQSNSYAKTSEVHEHLCISYRNDFPKYSREADWSLLLDTFNKLPHIVGDSRIKYTRISKEARSYKIKKALSLLTTAGLAHYIYNTNAELLPLNVSKDTSIFKLAFIDIGLMQFMLGFDWTKLSSDMDLTKIADGRLAEQFVAQELIAARSKRTKYQLHYWLNKTKGSDAEIDYIIEYNNEICPLEVKSGHRGTLKSLAQYSEKFSPEKAFVISQRQNENADNISWIPLYMAAKL